MSKNPRVRPEREEVEVIRRSFLDPIRFLTAGVVIFAISGCGSDGSDGAPGATGPDRGAEHCGYQRVDQQ
jgi:hypothetical protein